MKWHAAILVGWLAVASGVGALAQPPAAPRVPPKLTPLGKPDRLQLVYFVPRDRAPTDDYAAKIRVLMTFVADLYASDFAAQEVATSGFDFEFDDDGRPVVHLLRGAQPAARYSGAPEYSFQKQWNGILPEVEAVLGSAQDHFFVIFAETYDDGPAKFEWPGGVALGGQVTPRGAGALFSAWILRDEFCAATVARQLELLRDETPIEGRLALGHGQMNSPRFEFIEDGFGAVAHEVGHGLGLPHDSREDSRFIMGNGFRRLRENYWPDLRRGPLVGFSPDNLRLLAHSRFLATTPHLDDTTAPVANITHPTTLSREQVEIPLSIEVTDDRELAAVLFFVEHMGSVVGGAPLSGSKATLQETLNIRPLDSGTCQLIVKFIDRGGNIAQATVKMKVE